MKKKILVIVRIIAFFIIGLVILRCLTKVFVPKWVSQVDPASPRFHEFYSQKKDSLDVLVIGNSDVGRGYSPIEVWKDYGITSFNIGTSNQTMPFSYYILKEALKYQKPKVVVLDMDVLYEKTNAPEGEYRKLFDNLKLDDVKIEAVLDAKVQAEDQLSYFFPILRFHSRWNELASRDFKNAKENNYLNLSFMGMAMNCDVNPYIDKTNYMRENGKSAEILESNLYYLDKFVNLCRENNIQLLWVEFTSATSWSMPKSNRTQEIANQYGIQFIDYNLKPIMEEAQIDLLKDTADKGNHYNVYGAEKASKHLGNVLIEKYNCTSHKNNKKISKKWKKEVEKYNKNKKKLEKKKKDNGNQKLKSKN